MDERAHRILDAIYRTSEDPDAWQEVVDELSAAFGGSAVALGLLVPGAPHWAAGMPEAGLVEFLERLVQETPWSNKNMANRSDRFGDLSEDLGYIELSNLSLYKDWMKHHGLAPIWPGTHGILLEGGERMGGIMIFRKEGQPPFTEKEFGYADQFVPHLRRAVSIQRTLQSARQERVALGEAMDRLPTGILILDSHRRVVLQNEAARRIVGEDDGFRVDRNGPCVVDSRENAVLQQLIADALDDQQGDFAGGDFMTVSRPSGKREYAVMVSRLLFTPDQSVVDDLAIVIYVTDPEAHRDSMTEVLEKLYSLTHSEATLVTLLSRGLSLEEAAKTRGVSMNTARSHLKHAFAKTGTARQSELMRLVLSGVGAIGTE
jgi:DNA-binding CsgD family transcriptional regulator/PAS domain-containing protein